MRQLTSFDTQILRLEDGRNHGHVSVLAICDPSTATDGRLDLATLRGLIAERLHLAPPLRWRLAELPLGLDYPYWTDGPDVDVEFHVRELALPASGSREALAAQVERIVSRPLDRERPLWELYLIQGLLRGRVAVLLKVHHAAADGVAVGDLLGILLDPDASGFPASRGELERADAPDDLRLLARGVAAVPYQPMRAMRVLRDALPLVVTRARRPRRAPATVLDKRITPHRRVAFTRQSLTEVKEIKSHFGVTVNDVVVATCAGALRRWFEGQAALPSEPLVALVPVSVRTPEQAGAFGNHVSGMLVPIPTDVDDPVRRLRSAHEAMRSAKVGHDALPATMLSDAGRIVPPVLLSGASRLGGLVAKRLPGKVPMNTCISNVPGPQARQYLGGARVEATYPISAVMDGVGLNFTVMSYCGGLDYGVIADREVVGDPWSIARALDESHAELHALVVA